jgi:hypothetical protein
LGDNGDIGAPLRAALFSLLLASERPCCAAFGTIDGRADVAIINPLASYGMPFTWNCSFGHAPLSLIDAGGIYDRSDDRRPFLTALRTSGAAVRDKMTGESSSRFALEWANWISRRASRSSVLPLLSPASGWSMRLKDPP